MLRAMLFVLPSSKKQSKIKLRDSSFGGIEVYPFQKFTTKRIELINCLGVDMEDLLPVWRRFKNGFWDSLEFWVLPPPVQSFISDNSLVLSPLLGFTDINSPVPYSPLSWEDACNGKRLRDLWKEELKTFCEKLFEGKTVLSFLGKEEERLLSFRPSAEVVKFEFYRKGKRIMNAQRHKAYVLRYIAEKRLSPNELHRINFYDYKVKDMRRKGKTVYAILESEGAYF